MLVKEIERRLLNTLIEVKSEHIEVRVSKHGRDTYLLVHVVVAADFAVDSVAQLDLIRRNSEEIMKKWNPNIVMDMLFIKDLALAG